MCKSVCGTSVRTCVRILKVQIGKGKCVRARAHTLCVADDCRVSEAERMILSEHHFTISEVQSGRCSPKRTDSTG